MTDRAQGQSSPAQAAYLAAMRRLPWYDPEEDPEEEHWDQLGQDNRARARVGLPRREEG